MIAAIHQPNFLPWLGYIHKIYCTDIFILFDDVQFPRGHSFCNRVLIKNNTGIQWLTIPVKAKGDLIQINQVMIDYSGRWLDKLLKAIKINYQRSSYFNEIYDALAELFLIKPSNLIQLNVSLVKYILEYLNIRTEIVYSSGIDEAKNLSGSEKIISLLKAVNATVYLSGDGAGSRRYIKEEDFNRANIKLINQQFQHPVYPQLWNEFIPNLSIIDLLFNCGPESHKFLSDKNKNNITLNSF